MLDEFLPKKAPDTKRRRALISTWRDTYSGIPHTPTNKKLKDRCALASTIDDENAPYVEYVFEG